MTNRRAPRWVFCLLLCASTPVFAAGEQGRALQQAVEHRDIVEVRAALDAGADPNATDGFQPLLVEAAHDSQFHIAAALLDWGADPNAADGNHQTALTSLADDVPLALVQELLDRGGDVNGNPKASSTPLGLFAWASRLDLVRLLVGRGAGVNVRRGGGITVLMEAASRTRRVDVLQFLLDHGADVKARDDYGATALFYACGVSDNGAVLQFLLKKGLGANDVSRFETPLGQYAASGSLANVMLMLKHGADVNAATAAGGGMTALMGAAGSGRPDLVAFLLAHGADARAVTRDGFSALGSAAGARDDPALLQLLRDHGARVNPPPSLTSGPLASAAAALKVANVRWLIAQGADVSAADRSGKTPLMYARKGRESSAQSRDSFLTPQTGRVRAEIVRLLTDAGAQK